MGPALDQPQFKASKRWLVSTATIPTTRPVKWESRRPKRMQWTKKARMLLRSDRQTHKDDHLHEYSFVVEHSIKAAIFIMPITTHEISVELSCMNFSTLLVLVMPPRVRLSIRFNFTAATRRVCCR